MLEAPPQAPLWPGPLTNAEIIDALPYIDEDYYAGAAVKKSVALMVEEELRRTAKNSKPADFLKHLPPLAKPNFKASREKISERMKFFKIWFLDVIRAELFCCVCKDQVYDRDSAMAAPFFSTPSLILLGSPWSNVCE